MSRFANPEATERLTLGPCVCPGTPHDEDWMDLRSEFGAEDVLKIARMDSLDVLGLLIVRWNLFDNDGSTAPVDRKHINLIFADTFNLLDSWVTKHVRVTTVPNASGAPSRNGSRGSASQIRTIPGNG